MNYYERHLGDYARDTGHLSPLEHGVYNLLIDRYYATETPIPADQAHRICRARTKEEREAVDVVLEEFFSLEDGAYSHRRIEEEIEKARARIENARANGRRGGRPRKNPAGYEKETQKKPTGFPLGSESETQTKAHQTPDTRQEQEQEQKQKSLVQRAARSAARFPEFWAVYPVKKGRAEALAKWTARGLDAIADRIIADVQARKAHDRQWLDGYAPHGSTYVNGRGWEDEIETGRKPDRPGDGDGRGGVFGVAL